MAKWIEEDVIDCPELGLIEYHYVLEEVDTTITYRIIEYTKTLYKPAKIVRRFGLSGWITVKFEPPIDGTNKRTAMFISKPSFDTKEEALIYIEMMKTLTITDDGEIMVGKHKIREDYNHGNPIYITYKYDTTEDSFFEYSRHDEFIEAVEAALIL